VLHGLLTPPLFFVRWGFLKWVELYYFGRPEKPEKYLAYWRTRGGAHHYIIVQRPDAEQLIKKGWRVEREVTAENFFSVFRRYADFAVKKVGGIYYVTVLPNFMGWWIGKDGQRINAIKNILGCEVKLLYCIFIAKSNKTWYIGSVRFTEDKRGLLLQYNKPGEYIAIEWEGGFVKQFSNHGFIAPWQIKRVLGMLRVGEEECQLLNNPEALRVAVKQARKMFQLLPWIRVEDNGEVKEI
jgi:predicted RNA-binding protein YlqC (UPF0109 family)